MSYSLTRFLVIFGMNIAIHILCINHCNISFTKTFYLYSSYMCIYNFICISHEWKLFVTNLQIWGFQFKPNIKLCIKEFIFSNQKKWLEFALKGYIPWFHPAHNHTATVRRWEYCRAVHHTCELEKWKL